MSDHVALRIRVSGRVQGVGYRAWTVATARSLGLNGWVRNRTEGWVEIACRGTEEKVSRLLELCMDGPPAARVSEVVVLDDKADVPETGFDSRSTA